MDVILEYPATPDETRGILLAFADAGIDARLRAAPRRRDTESPVWRVVVNAALPELTTALSVPRFGRARALQMLVAGIADAWTHSGGHVEVGPRGRLRRATGGVLLAPDLPDEAFAGLVSLAATTLDPERLLLWNWDGGGWTTFDSGVPEVAPVGPSASERTPDVRGEGVQRRFRRGG